MQDNNILKMYLNEKRYDECSDFLKKKIIAFVINKIHQIDSSVEYTTVSDLIAASNLFLHDSSIALSLELALLKSDILERIHSLVNICEIYKIN